VVIYLHEINRVKSGKLREFLQAVESQYLPLVAEYDVRLAGYWETIPSQGWWPETVAVWELDDFAHYFRLLERQYSETNRDPRLDEWQKHRGSLIEYTEGLVCQKSGSTPDASETRRRSLRTKMCLHEMVHCAPARQAEYLAILEEMWWRRVAEPSGRSLIGLYWSGWKNTRAINIWGQGDEWDSMALLHPWSDEHAYGAQLWQTLGREIRTDWDDRFMVPVRFPSFD
jgi:hypothetical protein